MSAVIKSDITKRKLKSDKACEKWETCWINYKDWECCLNYANGRDNLIEYKRLCCNKNYRKVWWKLKETIFYYTQIFISWYH